jgi:cell division protein FtsQ
MARESKKSSPIRWKLWFSVAGLLIVFASSAVAAWKVHQFVASDSRFLLSRENGDAITITGLQYASKERIQRIFAGDYDHSILSAPLEERRRRLMAIDWVENASVSRLWPDRLAIHIEERHPVAFVMMHSVVLLIDAHGVLLDPPPQARFTFPVLSGLRDNDPVEVRLEKVRGLLRVQSDLGYMAKDVSEVNAADPGNLRIVAQVEERPVELILGDANFAKRYQNFVNNYGEIRKISPSAKTFDLRLDGRIMTKE